MHIHKIYGVPLDEATEKYKELIKELEKETKRKLKNFILRDRKDLSLNKDDLIDIAITEEIVEKWYEEFSEVLTPGKELLGKTKSYIQNTLKKDPNLILGQSEALIDENFISLIKGKYP